MIRMRKSSLEGLGLDELVVKYRAAVHADERFNIDVLAAVLFESQFSAFQKIAKEHDRCDVDDRIGAIAENFFASCLSFDPEIGVEFADWWRRNVRHMRSAAFAEKVGCKSWARLLTDIAKVKSNLPTMLGRNPTDAELRQGVWDMNIERAIAAARRTALAQGEVMSPDEALEKAEAALRKNGTLKAFRDWSAVRARGATVLSLDQPAGPDSANLYERKAAASLVSDDAEWSRYIASLTTPEERELMIQKYDDDGTWRSIAEKTDGHLDWTALRAKHDKAVERVSLPHAQWAFLCDVATQFEPAVELGAHSSDVLGRFRSRVGVAGAHALAGQLGG